MSPNSFTTGLKLIPFPISSLSWFNIKSRAFWKKKKKLVLLAKLVLASWIKKVGIRGLTQNYFWTWNLLSNNNLRDFHAVRWERRWQRGNIFHSFYHKGHLFPSFLKSSLLFHGELSNQISFISWRTSPSKTDLIKRLIYSKTVALNHHSTYGLPS